MNKLIVAKINRETVNMSIQPSKEKRGHLVIKMKESSRDVSFILTKDIVKELFSNFKSGNKYFRLKSQDDYADVFVNYDNEVKSIMVTNDKIPPITYKIKGFIFNLTMNYFKEFITE